MKKIFTFFILSLTILVACTKNQNIIKGTITYKDANGIVSNANQAVVSVMSEEDKAGLSYSYQVKSNIDGTYTINQVSDGDWYIYTTYKEDTLVYKGKSDLFKVKGDETVERSMTLYR